MMEPMNVYASRLVTRKEYFTPGHKACQGCAEALAVRLVAKALGSNVIVASATGCMEVVSTTFPYTSWEVPWMHVAFENAGAVISGIEGGTKALVRKGKIADKKTVFLGMGGDGATADIGFQALSGAFERGHDMVYVCYDNEAYMNTGIQRSSATPFGAKTTTSPSGKVIPGKRHWKKNMPELAVAHEIPYVATACASYPLDLIAKVEKSGKDERTRLCTYFICLPDGLAYSDRESDLDRPVGGGNRYLSHVRGGERKIQLDISQS